MDIVKLVKLMGMSTSPYDNEALTAIRMANAMLAANNLTWEQFVGPKTIVIQEVIQNGIGKPAKPRDLDIEEMLRECLENVTSSSGQEFIRSLADWYERLGFLTERQKEALGKWYGNL